MTDKPRMVVLQARRGSDWYDFAVGPVDRARAHIEANVAGVWRAITPMGEVVIEPRVHEHGPLFGVVTDNTATCECGARVTLVEGEWRTDWPPRAELMEGMTADRTSTDHQPSRSSEDGMIYCSCGFFTSPSPAEPAHSEAQYERHLDRMRST